MDLRKEVKQMSKRTNAYQELQLRNRVLAFLTKEDAPLTDEIATWLIREIEHIDCLKDKSQALLEILRKQEQNNE
jgi:hypothetical protein